MRFISPLLLLTTFLLIANPALSQESHEVKDDRFDDLSEAVQVETGMEEIDVFAIAYFAYNEQLPNQASIIFRVHSPEEHYHDDYTTRNKAIRVPVKVNGRQVADQGTYRAYTNNGFFIEEIEVLSTVGSVPKFASEVIDVQIYYPFFVGGLDLQFNPQAIDDIIGFSERIQP